MNIEEFRQYCLRKKKVMECFPFDDKTLVFKVAGKMFALAGLDQYPAKINLKCDSEKSIALREEFIDINPGFHMNKKHWNTIDLDWRADDELINAWIDHSYDLVSASLTKKLKEELASL